LQNAILILSQTNHTRKNGTGTACPLANQTNHQQKNGGSFFTIKRVLMDK
jgi:hypothetical protein